MQSAQTKFGFLLFGLALGMLAQQQIDAGGFSVPIIDDIVPSSNHADAWVLLVEESGNRSPATARVLASNYFGQLEGRELNFRLYDVDDESLGSDIKAEADRVGLPALVILTKDGKLLWSGNQPPTAESIDQIVKKETGQ